MKNRLAEISSLKSILQTNNLFAKKHLGQNFLINAGVLNKIIEAADLNNQDEVVEVGPGLGTLTIELAKRVKHLTTIEKDATLIPLLKKNLANADPNHSDADIGNRPPFTKGGKGGVDNVTILNQDALHFQPPNHPYKLVANIPYYITSPLINHFLKNQFVETRHGVFLPRSPTLIVLLTQKEVAKKICAKPPDMNVLALNIQTFAQVKIIDYVSKNSFYPAPKVDSAIIKILPYQWQNVDPKKPNANIGNRPPFTKGGRGGVDGLPLNLPLYFRLISAGFSQKRKKLHNSLSAGLHLKSDEVKKILEKAGIDGHRRAETLEIKEWINLTNFF